MEGRAVVGAGSHAGVVSEASGFAVLGLGSEVVGTLAGLGYTEPTPIQRESIPPLLAGRDLLGQAATGTGKTAAFALPLLERIVPGLSSPTALILVPTRELAMQVASAVQSYGRDLGVRVLAIYGGQSFVQQLRVLRRGVDVVVATPGRALDHLRRGTLPLDELRVVVLDEADEMLDMGFAEDIEAILQATPGGRQTVLFSATLPPRIAGIAERHLRDPVRIEIGGERVAVGHPPRVRQVAYLVPRGYRAAALGRVLDLERPGSAIIFCRTRGAVDELSGTLNGRGYRTEALHGGMTQEQRDRVMRRFRSGSVTLLVATDVAARGLDIEQLTHVVNYELPSSSESYVHRIGRVGRAGREGVALTLIEPREQRLLRGIEELTKQRIEVSAVPTLAELRARRLDLTRASLREKALAGDSERYRAVVDALRGEFDIVEITLAAIELAHEAAGLEELVEEEIPQVVPVAEARAAKPGWKGRKGHQVMKERGRDTRAAAPSAGGKRAQGKPAGGTGRKSGGKGSGEAKERPTWIPGGKGRKAVARRGRGGGRDAA